MDSFWDEEEGDEDYVPNENIEFEVLDALRLSCGRSKNRSLCIQEQKLQSQNSLLKSCSGE